jgi:hypothetical protein
MHYISTIVLILVSCYFSSCHPAHDKEATAQKRSDTGISDQIRVLGDSMLILKRGKSFDTLIRLYSLLEDSRHHVKTERLHVNKKLDFSHYEYGKMYKTRSTQEVREKRLNFAGHYSFVYWGCGSPCKLAACIDLKNRKSLQRSFKCYWLCF